MTKLRAVWAVAALSVTLVSVPVSAGPPRQVSIVVSSPECVDADAMASAIHRDTGLPVRVSSDSVPSAPHAEGALETEPDVVVEVRGEDQALTIGVRGAGVRVSQTLQATRCERASDVAAAFVVAALAPAPAVALPDVRRREGASPAPVKDESVAQKAALMVEDLDTAVRIANPPTWARWLGAISGAAFATGAFFQASPQMRHYYWQGAAGVAFGLGALSTFVVDDDYDRTVLAGSQEMAGGLVVLGFGSTNGLVVSPYAVGATSGAFLAESALTFLGAAIQRPISGAKLAADYRRVNSAEGRSALTAEDLSGIEADFRRTRSPFPRWVIATPWLAGGATTLVATFADDRPSAVVRTMEGLTGGLMAAAGLLAFFPQSGYDHYENRLRQSGLQASVGGAPGAGVSFVVHGRF